MESWKDKGYDSFMNRWMKLGMKYWEQEEYETLDDFLRKDFYLDASINPQALGAGPLLGEFTISDGYISSRDYPREGTGWALFSDGTTTGMGGVPVVSIVIFNDSTSVVAGDGKVGILIPAQLNGELLTAARAAVHTKGVTGTTDIQVRRRRAGSDVDMLSTKITIGDEFHAADCVIDTNNDDIATVDMLYFDVDAVHSGTAPKGLSVTLTF